MIHLRGRLFAILVFIASIIAGFQALPAMGLSDVFFDITDTSSCDLYNPFTAGSDTTTSKICDTTSRGVPLWAGQTQNVNFPMDTTVNYSGQQILSRPTSKIQAVFKNLPDADNNGVVEKSSLGDGEAMVNIKGAHMCADETGYQPNRGDILNEGYYADNPGKYNNLGGVDVTEYDIGGRKVYGQVRFGADACSGGNADISVDIKNAAVTINPVAGVSGMWYVDIVVRHIDVTSRKGVSDTGCRLMPNNPCDGIVNGYRATVSGSKSLLIGPAGTGKLATDVFDESKGEGYVASLKRSSNGYDGWLPGGDPFEASHYATYSSRFGSDCTVTSNDNVNVNSNTRYRIMFFDVDHQIGGLRTAKIRLKDETNNRWLYPQNAANPALYTTVTNGDTYNLNAGNWGAVGSVPTFNQSIEPPNLTLQYFAVSFPAIKDHKYVLYIANVENGLVFQYGVPFDSIFYARDCNLTDAIVQPQASWSDTAVEGGQSVNFSTSIDNVGGKTATINDARVRVWKDEGSKTFGAGDVAIPGSPWDPVNANTAINVGASLPLQSGSTTGDVNYAFLCAEVYSVAPVTVGPIQTIVQASTPACVKIGKYPSMKVTGGDVRSGGTYTTGTNKTCTLGVNSTGKEFIIRAHEYGGAKGATVENAIRTPGGIRSFGSVGLPYKYNPVSLNNDNSIKLLFGTDKWLTKYGFDAFGTGNESGYFLGLPPLDADQSTHCLPDLADQYDADTGAPANAPATAVITPGTSTAYKFTGNNQTLTLCSSVACTAGGSVTVNKNQRVILRITQPTGYNPALGKNTVVIKANVLYPNRVSTTYASIDEFPSFVLITDPGIEVKIDPDVTTINGVIGARDNVYTCGSYDGIASVAPVLTTTAASICTKALTYYGTVITSGNFYPFRTAGYDTAADTNVAELMSQLPETLLSNYDHMREQPGVTIDVQTELPPRL